MTSSPHISPEELAEARDIATTWITNAPAIRMAVLVLDLEEQVRSYEIESKRSALEIERLKEYEQQWADVSSPEFLDYWQTIGFTCSAGTAIKHLLEQVQTLAGRNQFLSTEQIRADLAEARVRELVEQLEALRNALPPHARGCEGDDENPTPGILAECLRCVILARASSPASELERGWLTRYEETHKEICVCGWPEKDCLRRELRNGPPYPPKPCEPREVSVPASRSNDG